MKFTLFLTIVFLFVGCSSDITSVNVDDNEDLIREDLAITPPSNEVFPPIYEPSYEIQTTLLVGDSLSSNTVYGRKLADFFAEPQRYCELSSFNREVAVRSYAVPSSAVRHYAYSSGTHKDWLCKQKRVYRNGTGVEPSGAELCKDAVDGESVFESVNENADLLVLSLGTNSLAFASSFVKKETKKLLDLVQEGQMCIWVTPTLVSSKYLSKAKRTIAAIKDAVINHESNCLLVESLDEFQRQDKCRDFTVKDGIHHTSCGSELWADKVIESVCSGFEGHYLLE